MGRCGFPTAKKNWRETSIRRELTEQNWIDVLGGRAYTPVMAEEIRILTTEPDGDDGLIVTFSDGTTAGYVVEELLALRPVRERSKTKRIEISENGNGELV